jgi:hypothetical protein
MGWAAAVGTVVAFLAVSCATSKPGPAPMLAAEGVRASQPPTFLVGPVSVLLTNAQDFAARVVVTGGNGLDTITAGNLFQKEGVLLYVPNVEEPNRPNPWTGSFRFVWEVAQSRGYIMSERLHGYALMGSPVHYATPVSQPETSPTVVEQIDEQPCVMREVKLSSSSGTVTTLRVWRPEALDAPPLRIVSEADHSTPSFRVQLANLNPDPLSQELFTPPAGFVRYGSPEAMIRELMRKEPVLPYSSSERKRR